MRYVVQFATAGTTAKKCSTIFAEDLNTKTVRQVASTSEMSGNERGMNDMVLAEQMMQSSSGH
jgi:hypothetical protein